MDRLILTGATLIYGAGADPVRERALVIEQGQIKAVIAHRAPPDRRGGVGSRGSTRASGSRRWMTCGS